MKKSPLFLYTTRHGLYYHLTPTNAKPLNMDTALISVGDFTQQQKLLQSQDFKMNFKQYTNHQNKLIYLTAIDSYKSRCVEGSMDEQSVKLQQTEGIKPFTIDQYNQMVRLIKPDMMVSLTELPRVDAGSKSHKRSIHKSAQFLKNSLEALKDEKIKIYGAIQGGLQVDLRQMAADSLTFAQQYENYTGVVFYGFTPSDPWDEKEAAIEAAFEYLKGDYLDYILAGKGDILSIFWGISWGINSFEIEEPFWLAQNLRLLILPSLDAENEDLEIYQNDRVNYFEFMDVKLKYLQFPLEMNKINHVAIDDVCECFTCKNHTKLYISHLVECREMNAQVLLSIHNSFTYQRLQKKLQQMMLQGRLNQWIRWFISNI